LATIGRHYFHVCLEGARRKGADVDELLRRSGVDPGLLEIPGWRGDVDIMARLVRSVWQALDDEFMGFTAAPMPQGAFAFACELALAGPTIAGGLAQAMRFYNLASRDIDTRLEEEHGRVSITVRFADPARDPDNYFSEFWLIIWHRLACWLAQETVPMVDAHFDYPRPPYYEEFKYLFPCNPGFEAGERSISLDAQALRGPVRRTREELARMLDEAPLAIMTIPASDRSLAREVRALLRADVSRSADDVAAALGTTADSLRRRLRGEGSGLAAIRENVRRDMATRQLGETGLSIEAIAASLGYAEARSFTRAFCSWTGMPPSRYRALHGKR
jgi:AraC-like DNA-binding protein